MTLSRAMQAAIDRFGARPEADRPPSIEQLRDEFAPGGARYAIPAGVRIRTAAGSPVPSSWLLPDGTVERRALLYLHGGAYRLGSLTSHAELAARIATATGVPALLPEYRLAPEHPYPAAVDDALRTWNWLVEEVGLDPAAIVVAGDSAGGGLALALMIALRDAARPLPAAAVLMSPWTDLTCSGRSMAERSDVDPVLTPERVRRLAADYLAGADPTSPTASPLFATLHGLPPLCIQAGSAEILLSDAERLALRAADEGVDVTLRIATGLPHVFQSVADAPEARSATDEAGRFLRLRIEEAAAARR